MRIQRLPEELAAPPVAPPVVDPQSLSGPPPVEKFVTGVRLPPPAAGRGRRLSLRGSTSPPGVKMEIDRSCTLLVCFHDDASSTGVNSGGAGAGSGGAGDAASGGLVRHGSSTSSAAGSQMEIPKWATQMGLSRTSMHVRKRVVEKQHTTRVSWRTEGDVPFFFLCLFFSCGSTDGRDPAGMLSWLESVQHDIEQTTAFVQQCFVSCFAVCVWISADTIKRIFYILCFYIFRPTVHASFLFFRLRFPSTS